MVRVWRGSGEGMRGSGEGMEREGRRERSGGDGEGEEW